MDLAAKQIFSFLQNFGSDNKIVILVTVDNGLYFDVSLKHIFRCMFIENTHTQGIQHCPEMISLQTCSNVILLSTMYLSKHVQFIY